MNKNQHDFYKHLGSRILEARCKQNLTQYECTKGSGVIRTPAGWCYLENGRRKIGTYEIIKIAEFLRVPIRQLLFGEPPLSEGALSHGA